MTTCHDSGNGETSCARCAAPIAEGQGELLMGTRWRTWIVCRRCAKAGSPAGGSSEPRERSR